MKNIVNIKCCPIIPSSTPTITPSITPTNTATPTITPTTSVTSSVSPTNTVTPTASPSNTVTPTVSPSNTATPTVSPTVTASNTVTPTVTKTNTPTPTNTVTQTVSSTPQSIFPIGANSANFNNCADWNLQNGNVTTVGTNGGPSSYGTYDQSGNVFEWNDLDNTTNSARGLRGGAWGIFASDLSSSDRNTTGTSSESNIIGFRIASRFSTLNPLSLPYFVSVVDAGNSNDSTGYGAVSYFYSIAQYLVTNCEYAVFLNAVAATDTYNLYNTSMNSDDRGGITRSGSSGSYTYSVKTNMGNKPVNYVTWFDCARYCNWLHNNKPSGSQNSSTTEDGAYTLNGATTGNAVPSNNDAKYHLPTENEWYKAAYYKGGGTNAGYWTYATQSNTAPTCVTADVNGNGPINSNYSCS